MFFYDRQEPKIEQIKQVCRHWKMKRLVLPLLETRMYLPLRKSWTFEQSRQRLDTQFDIIRNNFLTRVQFQVEYYVKWENYSDDHNQWVPAKNLSVDLRRAFSQSKSKLIFILWHFSRKFKKFAAINKSQ